jgi:hypothetical protein
MFHLLTAWSDCLRAQSQRLCKEAQDKSSKRAVNALISLRVQLKKRWVQIMQGGRRSDFGWQQLFNYTGDQGRCALVKASVARRRAQFNAHTTRRKTDAMAGGKETAWEVATRRRKQAAHNSVTVQRSPKTRDNR